MSKTLIEELPRIAAEDFSYSVVIRTLGNSGEKYHSLLQSITNQTVKPKEIIVVIPENYDLDIQLGCERVLRCKKGMVTQRAVGINAATTDYILVVDDDLEFDSAMVENEKWFYWTDAYK